jgi:hypothetical protein
MNAPKMYRKLFQGDNPYVDAKKLLEDAIAGKLRLFIPVPVGASVWVCDYANRLTGLRCSLPIFSNSQKIPPYCQSKAKILFLGRNDCKNLLTYGEVYQYKFHAVGEWSEDEGEIVPTELENPTFFKKALTEDLELHNWLYLTCDSGSNIEDYRERIYKSRVSVEDVYVTEYESKEPRKNVGIFTLDTKLAEILKHENASPGLKGIIHAHQFIMRSLLDYKKYPSSNDIFLQLRPESDKEKYGISASAIKQSIAGILHPDWDVAVVGQIELNVLNKAISNSFKVLVLAWEKFIRNADRFDESTWPKPKVINSWLQDKYEINKELEKRRHERFYAQVTADTFSDDYLKVVPAIRLSKKGSDKR